ncbi:MAG TPA: bifunctional folylpolyglutamate synthase/dihydrofolate synthase [Sulfurimonas sp. UBA12504]|nr:MAG: bifunctional folylpolyglutamate synthase/dihydrofolate synthase [Sulfurimonas sp. GWF2_37_8]DAB29137.1 MAG TPA: bifunctional folylpolyglutamate synthase/dihydrofolate synthase [Sulfurimonas sp. UBA12504]
MELEKFLDDKPLYYDVIDYTRMPRVYARIEHELKIPKIIHLIGTNGKGTTGRFLACALFSLGYKVGHYTSPHIVAFNERIWINGKDVSSELLDAAHVRLQALLTEVESASLSYFEYTTLIAMLLFEDMEYVVLEAGLGGEFDATAVFQKVLTLVTPIDKDHEAFLGDTIEAIATTKLGAVQNAAILAKQKHEIVYSVAATLKGKDIYKTQDLLSMADYKKIQDISYLLSLAPYLEENLKLSIAALKYFDMEYEVSDFREAKLFGRMSQIEKNILLDVGHNALAAASIAEALQGKKYTLIYNSYRDKDYKTILATLKPIIESVELIKVDEARIEKRAFMQAAFDDLKLEYRDFTQIKEEKNYLVFGSFSVAQKFLETYKKIRKD